MLNLTPIQKRLLSLWLAVARALSVPRHVQGGIAWALGLPPMAGASEQGGSAGGAGGEGGEGGGGEGGAGGSGGGSGGEGGAGGGAGGGEGWTPPTKAEWDNAQRQRREAEDRAKKLADDETERQRKADEEAGNHKAIADREREAREKAERERDELKQQNDRDREERDREKRDGSVTKIATRLKFRDADDVLHRLSDEDKSIDSNAEKALKALAKEKPYLLTDGEVPRQRELSNGDEPEGGSSTPQRTGVDRMADAYAASSSDK